MLMKIPPGRIVRSLIAAALLLGGCAATQIINQWSNPNYPAASFKRIMVIGVSKQTSIRRNFEDEFVAQLRATGADAVPSYEFTPENGPVEESRLAQAVKQAGADAVITTRLVRVERRAEYIPRTYGPYGPYGPYPGFGFYRWYSSAWVGFYEPPRLHFYDIYTSETSLHDVRNDRLVWSGLAKTTKLDDIRQETKEYVAVVIAALREKNLLAIATGR
ncbi:MAG: hypothetical protein Q8S00_01640 [Deltaproteobacteria bacterium]|nr:hypothetical protein [Deltaproteobacteria bacterium]MDZ4341303.1 hypothetical protein [Candidatus Binatia bacterium]